MINLIAHAKKKAHDFQWHPLPAPDNTQNQDYLREDKIALVVLSRLTDHPNRRYSEVTVIGRKGELLCC